LLARIIIIASVIIAGGILLFPDNLNQLIEGTSIPNTISNEINELQSGVNSVQNDVSNSITNFENQITDFKDASAEIFSENPLIKNEKIPNKIVSESVELILVGQVIEKDNDNETCKISVPNMAQTIDNEKELTHILDIENCQLEVGETVQINESQTNEPISIQEKQNNYIPQSTFTISEIPQSKIFETLQLTTVENEDGIIQVNYEDASGKTIKAHVVLRNAQNELFSGDFFTSKFQTDILLAENIPHLLEITIEHEEYGTVDSSLFYPAENYNQGFTGTFTE